MRPNVTGPDGTRWPVGPAGVWEHEVGMRAQRAAVAENIHGGYGLRTVIGRAVSAITGRRVAEGASE